MMHQIIKKYLFVTWVFIVLLIHYHFNSFKRAMLQLTFLQVFLVQMNDSKYMENKFFTFSSIFISNLHEKFKGPRYYISIPNIKTFLHKSFSSQTKDYKVNHLPTPNGRWFFVYE